MFRPIVLALLCAFSTSAAMSGDNVALNKPVTVSGSGIGVGWGGPLAAAGTVTDGLFLGNNHPWDVDTVYWSGLDAVVEIDLGGSFSISSFTIEADNNDTYRIDFRSGTSWQLAAAVPAAFNGGGLQLRVVDLPVPIFANALRISATGGDNLYSVSELQAFAQPVPEPETYALMLAGLGLVGAIARRRGRSPQA